MATTNLPPGGSSGNPPMIVDIETATATAVASFDFNAVELRLADEAGSGIRTWIGLDQAIDLLLRLAGAIARLKGAKP